MSKIMKFGDGPSPVTVGQEVVYTNGQGGRHHRISTGKVAKIGRELITLENGAKFYLSSGLFQTNYAAGMIYTSTEAYNRVAAESD